MRSCGGGEIEQQDRAARCCDRRSARFDHRTGARSVVVGLELRVRRQSLFFLSLCDLGSLFSLSLSLRKCFEVKLGTENNFRGQSLIFTVDRRSARFDHRTGARSVVVGLELRVRRQSLFFLSLWIWALSSLSLSLSLEML